jgi:hypothetical protein
MSIRAFDTALASRRDPDLAATLTELRPFLDMCQHASARHAFAPKALTWSASKEPLALSVLHRGETVWTVMHAGAAARWDVSVNGVSTRMTKSDALQHLAQALASEATMLEGVRFSWRKDDTIGGAF